MITHSKFPPLQRTLPHFDTELGGNSPLSGVIIDNQGILYGTASKGGSSNFGVAYWLTPNGVEDRPGWQENSIFTPANPGQGRDPTAPLVAGPDGVLYGTTQVGGGRNGTVFKLTPMTDSNGVRTYGEQSIWAFSGNGTGDVDGDQPHGGVVLGTDGALYGTTYKGGTNNFGAVYRLTPPATSTTQWTEQLLYSFKGAADGSHPVGELVLDKQGGLYGVTYSGGAGNRGAVFKLAPPAVVGGAWTEKVLYSFKGAADGSYPLAGVFRTASDVIYGTTVAGGGSNLGTMFVLNPPTASSPKWTHTVLHSFGATSDGASPESALIADKTGALYGMTYAGGSKTNCSAGCGTVFKVTP